jgi:(p)ppGpp synthase/HD superfamily hydrolase
MRGVERGMLGRFSVEVKDRAHLTKVIKAIRAVKGVVQVDRRDVSEELDLDSDLD